MMKKLIAVLALVPYSVLVAADSESPDVKKESAPIKFSITAGADYTDNRDASPTKVKNTDLFITPRLALDLKWEAAMLDISYAPTYRYRTKPATDPAGNELENKSQLYHDFGLAYTVSATPDLKLRVNDNFDYTDDPAVQANGSTLSRDSSFVYNRFEGGANYAFSRLSNLDAVGRYMTKLYKDDERKNESNVDQTDLGLNLWNQPAKLMAFTGTASFSSYGYKKYLGADRDFQSVFLGAGIQEVFSPEFQCGLSGGLQSSSYDDKAMKSDNSPYGTLSATVATIPSTRITGSVSYMTRDSFIYPFASQKMTDFELKLDWDSPNPDLTFGLAGSYWIGKYDSDKISPSFESQVSGNQQFLDFSNLTMLENGGTEKTVQVAFNTAYKIGIATKLGFVVSYSKTDSDVRWSYNRMDANLSMTREF